MITASSDRFMLLAFASCVILFGTACDSSVSAPLRIRDANVIALDDQWIVQDDGHLIHVANDKRTLVMPEAAFDARLVDFLNSELGWVVGSKGELLMTRDAGASWKSVASVKKPTGGASDRLNFVDEMRGWLICGSTLSVTADGGTSWRVVPLPNLPGDTDFDMRNPSAMATSGDSPSSIWVGTVGGVLMHSADMGRNWEVYQHQIHQQITAICPTGGEVWVGTQAGDAIYVLDDHNRRWTRVALKTLAKPGSILSIVANQSQIVVLYDLLQNRAPGERLNNSEVAFINRDADSVESTFGTVLPARRLYMTTTGMIVMVGESCLATIETDGDVRVLLKL